MNVTQKIKMDLISKQNIQTIHAVHDDTNSRYIEISLFECGIPWKVPENSQIAISYLAANGANGIYDTLPNGADAYIYGENKITIILIPSALYPGTTKVTVVISDENSNQISTFPLNVEVDENYSYGASKPETYINLRQWLSKELANLVWDYAINVYPDQAGDGYVSERPYDAILREYESGRAMYCALEISDQERLQLPFVKIDGGVLYFSAVFDGKEYLVIITADGVTVEISECGGGNSGGNVDIPENVALLEDVTVDEASGDFIPMLSANGTEYRLSIGDDGIPFIKNLSGATVWSGTSGGNSGGGDSGDTGGGDTGEGGDNGDGSDDVGGVNWVSGAEVAYTLVDGEYVDDDGSFGSNDKYSRTDYIYCYGAGHIYHSVSGSSSIDVMFYDINKNLIYATGGYDPYNAVPENAAYVVMSHLTEVMTGGVIKLYKKVEPTWTDGEPYAFAFVENEYINPSTGEPVTYSGWKRTDYVNCAGATRITKTNASANSQYGCFYNAEKEMLIIMHTPDTTNGAADITIPVGACYFRTSDSNANMDALVLVPHA